MMNKHMPTFFVGEAGHAFGSVASGRSRNTAAACGIFPPQQGQPSHQSGSPLFLLSGLQMNPFDAAKALTSNFEAQLATPVRVAQRATNYLTVWPMRNAMTLFVFSHTSM